MLKKWRFQLAYLFGFSINPSGAIALIVHGYFLKHLAIRQRHGFQELLCKLALEVDAVVGTLDVCNLMEVSSWIGFQYHQPAILASPHGDQIQDLPGKKKKTTRQMVSAMDHVFFWPEMSLDLLHPMRQTKTICLALSSSFMSIDEKAVLSDALPSIKCRGIERVSASVF